MKLKGPTAMQRTLLRTLTLAVVSVFTLALALPALAQEEGPTKADIERTIGKPEYSPYAGREYPTRVFWGDTHLHTAISVDAGAALCRLGQEEAYRLARGEEVLSSTGQRVKLSRPLDFLVIADHADLFVPLAPGVLAHELRPAYLDLRQSALDTYDVLWKVPARGEDLRLALYARFPEDCQHTTPRRTFADDAFVERWRVHCSGGLTGSMLGDRSGAEE